MTDRPMLSPLLKRIEWGVLIAFAAVVGIQIARYRDTSFLKLFVDTDDATRLAGIRDFLGGQNWFDHLQTRYDTPFGVEIHWSRLIDAPIAGIISGVNALAPGMGPGLGERIALFAWPLLLLLPALWLTVILTRRLTGPDNDLVTLAIAALSIPLLSEFAPGRIDHHNVQAVLVLWLAIETVHASTGRFAALRAGIAAATSLAIGAETLPFMAAAIAGFGLNWVIDSHQARPLREFGLSLALGMAVHLLIAVGPGDWLTPRCDAISIAYVAAAAGTALAFAILSLVPSAERAWGRRLALGLAAAALVGLGLIVLFPNCLAGPFGGMDPFLRKVWLPQIVEIKPVWESFAKMPAFVVAASLPPVLGLVGALVRFRAKGGEDWRAWLPYALLLTAGVIGLVLQMRGVRLAALLAVPGAVWLIAHYRARHLGAQGARRIGAALAMIAVWMASTGFVVFLSARLALPEESGEAGRSLLKQCLSEDTFTGLAQLSPARLAAPNDLGPYVVLMTPHAVIGAPYHRNSQGVLDTYRIFGDSEAEARDLIEKRGIDFVVTCTPLTERDGDMLDAPDALAPQLLAGEPPDWLTPVSTKGPLGIYRVKR